MGHWLDGQRLPSMGTEPDDLWGKLLVEVERRRQAALAGVAVPPAADGLFDLERAARESLEFTARLYREAELRQLLALPDRPRIVCLCGSTRFGEAFARANLQLTLAGMIVLSVGCCTRADTDVFGTMTPEELDRVKRGLDALHLKKIELADEVMVLNVGGYVGESTAREVAHAKSLGKPVRWLEPAREAEPALSEQHEAA